MNDQRTIDVILNKLDRLDNKLDKISEWQHRTDIEVKGLKMQMATIAAVASLIVAGVFQWVHSVFF